MAQTPVPVQGPVEVQSQGSSSNKVHLEVREVHPQTVAPVFPLKSHTPSRRQLAFLSPEQMAASDRALAEANQGEIARRAELQGFRGVGGANRAEEEISRDGGWGYEQAVCPVFPEHLILEYSRGQSNGDVTLFSAVIPRGEGHVRVIPVRRRGYSLWTPASSNALTINDFNHMVMEGGSGLSPDWLTLGLCYTALAGGHVRAALLPQKRADEVFPLLAPAMLSEGGKADTTVRISDATPQVKAMDWVMSFDRKGRLVKVKHVPSQLVREKPVPGAAVEVSEGQK